LEAVLGHSNGHDNGPLSSDNDYQPPNELSSSIDNNNDTSSSSSSLSTHHTTNDDPSASGTINDSNDDTSDNTSSLGVASVGSVGGGRGAGAARGGGRGRKQYQRQQTSRHAIQSNNMAIPVSGSGINNVNAPIGSSNAAMTPVMSSDESETPSRSLYLGGVRAEQTSYYDLCRLANHVCYHHYIIHSLYLIVSYLLVICYSLVPWKALKLSRQRTVHLLISLILKPHVG
jgi:hypothetical protein